MDLNAEHPINIVLCSLAHIIGANFVIKSARDSSTEENKFPLLEYVIHKEGEAKYDYSRKAWRVELVIQLDYQLEEDGLQECIPHEELDESLAIQGIQFSITSKLRSLIQLMIDPGSLGANYKASDFVWSKYDFKLVRFVESAYFRLHGTEEVTGAASLFILSLLDVDNVICCIPEDLEAVKKMVTPGSVTDRLIDQQLNP